MHNSFGRSQRTISAGIWYLRWASQPLVRPIGRPLKKVTSLSSTAATSSCSLQPRQAAGKAKRVRTHVTPSSSHCFGSLSGFQATSCGGLSCTAERELAAPAHHCCQSSCRQVDGRTKGTRCAKLRMFTQGRAQAPGRSPRSASLSANNPARPAAGSTSNTSAPSASICGVTCSGKSLSLVTMSQPRQTSDERSSRVIGPTMRSSRGAAIAGEAGKHKLKARTHSSPAAPCAKQRHLDWQDSMNRRAAITISFRYRGGRHRIFQGVSQSKARHPCFQPILLFPSGFTGESRSLWSRE